MQDNEEHKKIEVAEYVGDTLMTNIITIDKASMKFSGDFMIITDETGSGNIFNLKTVKGFKLHKY